MKIQIVLLMLVLVALVTARKGRKKGHGRSVGNLGCQYDKGQWGACDESTNEMKRTLTLKEVKDGCDATMEQTRPCKRKQNKQKKKCKYDKSDWGDCDTATNMVSRTLTLRKGEDGCKQTQIQTISCEKFLQMKKMKEEKKTAKEGMKAEKMLFKAMHRKLKDLHKLGCRFKEEVEPCNKETQKVKKTFTLESGDVTQCKMDPIEISCKIQEKIERKKQMKLEKKQKRKQMKKERKEHKRKNKKELKKQKKKNHKRNRSKGKKQEKCQYEVGPWSECDITTDTIKMTMTLKPGDTSDCPTTKSLSKKCKKPCKYTTGRWGPCVNGITERVDRLKKNSQDICEPVRRLTKKCKGRKKIKKNKGGCIYDKGSWESCDPVTNKRAKKKLLKSGDTKTCTAEKLVYRSCIRANGEDRCFFGTWGDWSDCQNGVQKKQRQVVQGGMDCQKKAVKTRPCS